MTDVASIIERPSPNHDARPDGTAIDILLLHYTGMRSAEEALERLTDPDAKVSAHYLIEEDGTCHRMVPETRRAWHAGVASWCGASDINARSIGIEIVNPGHQFGYRPFPEAQMAALVTLCRDILDRHPAITPERVLAHSDVAPDRKEDPGELFDWPLLARNGIGIWPEPATGPGTTPVAPDAPMAFEDAARLLSDIGYRISESPAMTGEARSVILAFQRRWMGTALTGALTPETACRLREIHTKIFP